MAGERAYQPPVTPGEAFRADPADPAPFLTENDKVPVVPVERTALPAPEPRFDHPPTHSPAEQGGPPLFRQPGAQPAPHQATPLTPEQRFARTAFWTGVVSLFIFNIILGPIAVVMGVMAIRRGEKQTGSRAIILGSIGTALGIALIVLAAAGVIPSVDEMLRDIQNQK